MITLPGRSYCCPDHVNKMTKFGSEIFFEANDGTNGRELWKTDGTTASLVMDINPGSGHSFPTNFTEYDGTFYCMKINF